MESPIEYGYRDFTVNSKNIKKHLVKYIKHELRDMDVYILMELNIVVLGTISPHLIDTTDLEIQLLHWVFKTIFWYIVCNI